MLMVIFQTGGGGTSVAGYSWPRSERFCTDPEPGIEMCARSYIK